MRVTYVLLMFSFAQLSTVNAYHPTDFDSRLEVIAFGSCNRQSLPQPLWPIISKNTPDLWIWSGDNIYGDSKDPKVIAERYKTQIERPDYQAFSQRFPIVGTWDDHDYGWNNAGREYPIKQATQGMALDFMQVPADDPRRHRPGIYGAYDFGPEGQRVKVILLDGRYFATHKNAENPELIGEPQKTWLANQLKNSAAQIHLIVSGIQVIPEDHNWESWAQYPADREWLLNLIAETKTPGVIFISGDRHIHELSMLKDVRIDYPLVDATSSGLTHSWENFKGEPNQHRVGEVYTQLGFGLIHFDWQEPSYTSVSVEIRNTTNQVVNNLALKLPNH